MKITFRKISMLAVAIAISAFTLTSCIGSRGSGGTSTPDGPGKENPDKPGNKDT